jgi:ABC-type phosphate/phosphonate transport system ATPase subunit
MIVVEDLHFSYPNSVEALKGVSITINDGEFVAIMGQNGAGQTLQWTPQTHKRNCES